MEKSNFYIAIHQYGSLFQQYKFQQVSGFVEKLTSPDGTVIRIGINQHHENGDYYATELTTGYYLSKHASSRQKLLKEITDDFLQSVSNLLKTETAKNAIKRMENRTLYNNVKGI